MDIRTLGLDLGKTSFHAVGVDGRGHIVLQRRFSRPALLRFLVKLPPCLIGMEACCGAHYLGRTLGGYGHEVRLMPPQYARPFVKSHKNDYRDAEAIAEAVQRPTMRFVPIKSVDQLDLQALHRVRDRLVSRRTGVISQLRAFLLERGLAPRTGRRPLARLLPAILEDDGNGLSTRVRELLQRLHQEWHDLEASIKRADREIAAIATADAACQRLLQVPGIGPLCATAMVASIGHGHAFRKGRDFAAWLGLVPRQHSSGGKPTLLGISKAGNSYLRRLLVHGARSVCLHLHRQRHALGRWIEALERRAHRNVVAVALANKLARIAWAVLARGESYQPDRTMGHPQAA
jgi:transposase